MRDFLIMKEFINSQRHIEEVFTLNTCTRNNGWLLPHLPNSRPSGYHSGGVPSSPEVPLRLYEDPLQSDTRGSGPGRGQRPGVGGLLRKEPGMSPRSLKLVVPKEGM